MTINDKIKQILFDKNISPSYFADEIGVQRSSISHILSGRNRPSFDIIQKIIRRFPELGYEWIMEEEPMSSQTSTPSLPPSYNSNRVAGGGPVRFEQYGTGLPNNGTNPVMASSDNASRSVRNDSTLEPVAIPLSAPQSVSSVPVNSQVSASGSSTKTIERILVFFSDGSFKDYLPAV